MLGLKRFSNIIAKICFNYIDYQADFASNMLYCKCITHHLFINICERLKAVRADR